MQYIDLTYLFNDGTPVYPGDSTPKFELINNIKHDGFTMYKVDSGMHVGTHIDAPLHFIENGRTIDKLSVESFFGDGVYVDAQGMEEIGPEVLEAVELSKGDILLVHTGHCRLWGQAKYFTAYPSLTVDFARSCVKAGVSVVCVDMPSVDYDPFETHKMLLENGVLIVENGVNFDLLAEKSNFKVIALPVKFQTEAAPVRLVAVVE